MLTDGDAMAADRAMASLLQLLAEEAPPESFDQLSESVAAGGADRDLVLALAQAGHIREQLAHRKRREKETHALYETARDLSSLRDVDGVLEAIVARARQLLGTDATYLAMVDPNAGDVYMRITLGTVTRAIESVRQNPGQGVGGRIVQTGRPYATSNYLADLSLDRNPDVTDAVIEDGIVGIAGVPLRVGEDVIGVLFGANRYERAFEPAEVALLSSLADHASILIENARLFARAEATAQQLTEANDQLSVHGQALERGISAHEQLMPMALRRADLPELPEAVAGMLDGAVSALDENGQVLATAAAPGSEDLLEPLPGAGRRLGTPGPHARPGTARRLEPLAGDAPEVWAVPVQAGSDTFGHLLLAGHAALLEADVRILERAAQTAALLLLMERQVSTAEQQVRGELIHDLLAEREPDWTSIQRRTKRSVAIDFTVPHTVLVLSGTGVTRRRLLRAAADYAAPRHGLATEHAAHVVLLLPGIDADDAARTVPPHLNRMIGAQVTAGVAGPGTSAAAVRALHRDAERCHRLLLALGRAGQGACREDLGVLGLVLDGTSRGQVQRLIADTIGEILRYDAQHGSLLRETLDGYFAAGQNPRRAAHALQVHPNTVYQRLERVDQVLGHKRWREPQGALTMQTALQLHRVLDHIQVEDLGAP
ncbi:MAG: GAF domain-containing protein [Pseudonocardiaceae bacterium]|nr:GAF domain-containing protein [Pseudonocardiaceae bacterium]